MESVTRAVLLPVAPAPSQAGGGAQTPATRTPEPVAPQVQVPVVQPAMAVQPGVVAQPDDGAAMSADALWRLDRFTKLFTTTFSGAFSEDPQDYLDSCHKVLRNMGIFETNGVDFVTFRLSGSAKTWWRDYCLARPAGSPSLTWEQFAVLFLEKFLLVTQREAFRRQFDRLQQGSMMVTQYETRFIDLARHSLIILPTERERVRRFIDGLIQLIRLQIAKEAGSEISFQKAANVAHRVGWFCHREVVMGRIRGPVIQENLVVPRLEVEIHMAESILPGPSSQLSRFCPRAPGSSQHQSSRAMISVPGVSQPAQPARGRGKGARGGGRGHRGGAQTARDGGQPAAGHHRDMVQGGGAQPRCYALPARSEAESSDAVITGIILVCDREASMLYDPGSTYSYVSSYFAPYLVLPSDPLSIPVYVSTPVGDSIMVDRVHYSCIMVIGGLETRVDLLLLDMVDFDVILGIDWLSPYHAILDCHAKTVTLALPNLPLLEWRGVPGYSTRSVISYMKARRMVEKGCLAYLAYVRDSNAEVPSIDSVPMVREFPEANVVVDALSRKSASMGSLVYIPVSQRPFALDVQALTNRFVRLYISEPSQILACIVAHSSLLERICDRQFDDPHLCVLRDTVQRGGAK
ncbi:uncharacterized protein [Nicotiana sylvestris]|uniref:uncharacterized protein n=1 Tax=Nicotiana sylvestris TaxID=4096 RepID=UPI00388C5DD3